VVVPNHIANFPPDVVPLANSCPARRFRRDKLAEIEIHSLGDAVMVGTRQWH